MSSTSSNECVCDQMQYGGTWADTMQSPWYPTYGQPLIYYSQVHPVRTKKRSKESEKHKRNCFQKAYHWYTEERMQIKKTDTTVDANNADIKGFAAWLDEKYDEFMQSNERTKYILTQASTVDINRTTKYKQFDKPVEEKRKKIKSPWKKRRKHLITAEKGDVIVHSRSNQSIKIILKPKDLSRPASECCLRTEARTCRNPSSSTVESYASTLQRVTKLKSESLNSIVKEREIYMIPFDAPEYGFKQEKYRQRYEKALDHNIPKENSMRTKYQTKDISCQCSKDTSAKVDAASQFENRIKRTNWNYCEEQNIKEFNLCGCNEQNTKANALENKSFCDCYIETNAIIPENKRKPTLPRPKPVYSLKKEEFCMLTANILDAENKRTSSLAIINDGVQTSDHSIHLNKIYSENPLLLKIICADKLKKS